jgi:hypothetical protein
LVLIVSLIDNNLIIGPMKAVEKTKKDLMERFDCKMQDRENKEFIEVHSTSTDVKLQ